MSPALFNLFLERIMTEALENALPGVNVGGRPLKDLRFADNIALLATNEQDLQNNTSSLNRTAQKYCMEISKEKTKPIVFQKGNTELQCNINIENEQIEQVDHFKYLGILFTKAETPRKKSKSR